MALTSRLLIILVTLPLAACGTYQSATSTVAYRTWDGRFPIPSSLLERHPRNFFAEATALTNTAAEESQLAQHPKYSTEWWSTKRAFDQREEARLAKATAICRGCDGLAFEDTASIGRSARH